MYQLMLFYKKLNIFLKVEILWFFEIFEKRSIQSSGIFELITRNYFPQHEKIEQSSRFSDSSLNVK